MATSAYIANLVVRRQAIVEELAALDANKPGGKPNTTAGDGGTTIDHEKYKSGLYAELKAIDEAIKRDAETQTLLDPNATDPFEIVTRVFS